MTWTTEKECNAIRQMADTGEFDSLTRAMRGWIADIDYGYDAEWKNSDVIRYVGMNYIGGVPGFIRDGE